MLLNYLLIIFCSLAILFSVMVIISKNPIHSILYLIFVFCSVTFVFIILGVEFLAITFLIVYVGAIAVLFLFVVMMLNIKILELDEVFWKYIPVGLLISSIFLFQLFFLVFKLNIIDLYELFFFSQFGEVTKIQLISKLSILNYSFVNGIFSGNEFYNNFQSSGNLICQIYNYDNLFFVINNSNSSLFNNYFSLVSQVTNTELLGWLIYTYTFFVFLVVSLLLFISMIGSIVLVLNQNINLKRQLIFRQSLRGLKSSVILKN
jgi:NADH-ubiquinone oxidoreductase chain 6